MKLFGPYHNAPAVSVANLVGVHRAVANRPAFVSAQAVESEIRHIASDMRFVPPDDGLKEAYARTFMDWINGKRGYVFSSQWTVRQSLAQDMRVLKALLDQTSFEGDRIDDDDLKGLERSLMRTQSAASQIRRRRIVGLVPAYSIGVYLGIIDKLTEYTGSADPAEIFTRGGIAAMVRLIEEPMHAQQFLAGLSATMRRATVAVAEDLPAGVFLGAFSLTHVVEDAMNAADGISTPAEPARLTIQWNEPARTMTIDTGGDARLWNALRENPAALMLYRNEKTNWHVRGDRLVVPVGSAKLFEFWEKIISEVWRNSATIVPLIVRVARGDELDRTEAKIWRASLARMTGLVAGFTKGDGSEGLLNVLRNMVAYPSNFREALIKELVAELCNTLTPFAVLERAHDNPSYARRVAQRIVDEHGVPRSMLPFERLFEIYGFFRGDFNVAVDAPSEAVIPYRLYETNLLFDRMMWCAAGIADDGERVSLSIGWDASERAVRIDDRSGEVVRMLREIERFPHLFPKPMATMPRLAAWVSGGRGLVLDDDHVVTIPLAVVADADSV